jgi:hypothetical protein
MKKYKKSGYGLKKMNVRTLAERKRNLLELGDEE